jgi:hypothetical protein
MHSSMLLGPVVSSHVAGPTLSPQKEGKPQLISFDSSREFSLEHLLEVCKLVEREDRELKGYVFDDECLRVS